MVRIISLISKSVFCITVILYIHCPLSAIYVLMTDKETKWETHKFISSGAARLNTPLVAYCNQENSVRDPGVHLLCNTQENRCIKWESRDYCSKWEHCLGNGNKWGSNMAWSLALLGTQLQAAGLPQLEFSSTHGCLWQLFPTIYSWNVSESDRRWENVI